jgi:N-acetylglucosamine kinase-like BadF-type ATPase
MRAFDGRLDSPALLSLVTENFSHPEEAYIDLQTSTDRVARIAGFARNIMNLAEHDVAAADIVRSAGRELAISAVAAAKRVGLLDAPAPRFSWTGNVMKSDLLRETFVAEVMRQVPRAVLAPPAGEPVDGVALLEHVPAGSPLMPVIHAATR